MSNKTLSFEYTDKHGLENNYKIVGDKIFIRKLSSPEPSIISLDVENGQINCTYEDNDVPFTINNEIYLSNLTSHKALILLGRMNCKLFAGKGIDSLRRFYFEDLAINKYDKDIKFANIAEKIFKYKTDMYLETQENKIKIIQNKSNEAKRSTTLAMAVGQQSSQGIDRVK